MRRHVEVRGHGALRTAQPRGDLGEFRQARGVARQDRLSAEVPSTPAKNPAFSATSSGMDSNTTAAPTTASARPVYGSTPARAAAPTSAETTPRALNISTVRSSKLRSPRSTLSRSVPTGSLDVRPGAGEAAIPSPYHMPVPSTANRLALAWLRAAVRIPPVPPPNLCHCCASGRRVAEVCRAEWPKARAATRRHRPAAARAAARSRSSGALPHRSRRHASCLSRQHPSPSRGSSRLEHLMTASDTRKTVLRGSAHGPRPEARPSGAPGSLRQRKPPMPRCGLAGRATSRS